jgi:hypothetical protein
MVLAFAVLAGCAPSTKSRASDDPLCCPVHGLRLVPGTILVNSTTSWQGPNRETSERECPYAFSRISLCRIDIEPELPVFYCPRCHEVERRLAAK